MVVKKKKISKEMEERLKETYPEGRALDLDRTFDAQTMLDPNKPEDVRRWAERKNKVDLAGFDDRSGREPSKKDVLKRTIRGDSGDVVLQTEPERLVDGNSVAGKLIERMKDKIVDYDSFIKAVKKAWGEDDSLSNMLDFVSYDSSFKEMFRNPIIQGYVRDNTTPTMINYIMKKFGVEPVRASRIVNKLPSNVRAKLFYKARQTRLPKIRLPKSRPTRTQRTQRTQRRRWSEEELRILRANRTLPPVRVAEIFNNVTGFNRSYFSIRNKLYRIRRDDT